MSEQDAALVERVAESIRPLHDRPAHNGEYLSKTDIHQYAREVIAAVRGEGLEALLEPLTTSQALTIERRKPGLWWVEVYDESPGEVVAEFEGTDLRAAVEAALGEGE